MLLLEWVLTSVFLILVMLLVRAALGGRISARLRYALWAVVLVRLLVPVQLFTTPLAGTVVVTEQQIQKVYTSSPPVHAAPVENTVPPLQTGTFPEAPNVPSVPAPPPAPSFADMTVWLQRMGRVWLAGGAVLAAVFVVTNVNFGRRLKRAREQLEGTGSPLPVYRVRGLTSPCLFGLLRPAIYVTPEAAEDPDMLRHVLAHELTHWRHLDDKWNLLRCAALCIHWWNPLVWLAAVFSRRDGEMACDEGALRRLGDGERAAYGRTLLRIAAVKSGPRDLICCATTMADGRKSLKERVSRIARAPKRLVWAAVAAVLVLTVASVCAFGQKEEAEKNDGPALSGQSETLPCAPDLNRNGTPEQLRLVEWESGEGYTLQVWEGEELVWSEEAGKPHTAWNALFLCMPEAWEGDFLLRYRPTMFQGICSYSWELFRLEDGEEMVFGSDRIDFDINFGSEHRGEFDAHAIAAFMDGINELLARSVQLVNTDQDLLDTFEKVGRLEDTLWWLDSEAFVYDETVSLEQNLLDYRADMEKLASQPAPAVPEDLDLNRNGIPEQIRVFDVNGLYTQVEVREGETLLWSGEAGYIHAGENSIFLCAQNGQYYLLEYDPHGQMGIANYHYRLFDLTGDPERVVQANEVTFNYIANENGILEEFDPEAIAAFMDEINSLLANSVLLADTTYAFDGQTPPYHDSLEWMDRDMQGLNWDRSASLQENLERFRQAHAEASGEYLYQGVLLGTLEFTYQDGQTARQTSVSNIPGLINSDPYTEIQRFAVADLDGDGKSEVVLWVCGAAGDGGSYLVLYQRGGAVYGWKSGPRTFENLKTDGTFEWSDPTGGKEHGVGAYRDLSSAQITQLLRSVSSAVRGEYDAFYLDGGSVSAQQYQAAMERQRAKPDAAWYDFTRENISSILK